MRIPENPSELLEAVNNSEVSELSCCEQVDSLTASICGFHVAKEKH